MKILYLSARFPWPPDRGDRLTGYRFIETMARRHAVTLLSFTDGSEPAESTRQLERHCAGVETIQLSRARSWSQAWLGLLSSEPSQVHFYRSAEMSRKIRTVLAAHGHDAIFVQLFRMAPYVTGIDHSLKVLFLADSLGLALRRSLPFVPAWKTPGVRWEARRVERFEIGATRHFRESWVLSPEEAARLQSIGGQRVRAIRHGVDERLFALPAPESFPETAVFLGNLGVPHNRDAAIFAAREIWPKVRTRKPEAVLRIAGAGAGPEIRALAAQPGVEIVGYVPDLVDVWRGAGVLLAPLRYSTGIQNKVLEAMAAGIPVVSTPQVLAGIDVAPGVHASSGTDAESLAAAVLDSWANPPLARERAARAREHVRERFTWEESVRRLECLAAGIEA